MATCIDKLVLKRDWLCLSATRTMCCPQALYQFLTMCNVRQHNPFCHMDPCPVVAAASAYVQRLEAAPRAAHLCNVLCACSGVGQRLPTAVLDSLAELLLGVQAAFTAETYGRVRGVDCGKLDPLFINNNNNDNNKCTPIK